MVEDAKSENQEININSQVKKDEKVASRMSHLEPRSIQEEDKNKLKRQTKDVDNQPDIKLNNAQTKGSELVDKQ